MTAAATLLAFDYGEKRIGVALGNALLGQARALTIIENRDRAWRFEAVGRLIAEWQPDHLVVGLPCHPDGAPHAMTQLARRFGNQLNGRFGLPVSWVDERYSSRAAADVLAQGGRLAPGARLDAEAARIILQQYFDENGLA
ncbi:Holliday junction resolvase RuvX [Chitinasiproducens palmae]|uniref:Putative pre-16S rRNA nuclease n=1 Tax=Chitinasiproducens palmae TaxID=1770053 RepID=A0A1H2PMR7_9BURK|nr:Holliday junction resolvase RuvX [Chitinasiproducens palmae]SDV47852.1 putative holliday junction resolvase [Chitinasiproducens palmae]